MYLGIINYIQIIVWNDVTNQFVDVNPDDISIFYLLRTILIFTYGRTRKHIFPTPNHSLPFFVQTIEIDFRKQVEQLENIIYGRVVPDEIRETKTNAVSLVYDKFQVPTP